MTPSYEYSLYIWPMLIMAGLEQHWWFSWRHRNALEHSHYHSGVDNLLVLCPVLQPVPSR
jgi:hypothetical protein